MSLVDRPNTLQEDELDTPEQLFDMTQAPVSQATATSVLNDGSRPMSGALNMGSNLVRNVAAPVLGTDAATRSFVEGLVASSGTYTPTIVGVVNVASVGVSPLWTWVRVGDVLLIGGQVAITVTAAAPTALSISLPPTILIPSFSATSEAFGVGADQQSRGGRLEANVGSALLAYNYRAIGTSLTNHSFQATVRL